MAGSFLPLLAYEWSSFTKKALHSTLNPLTHHSRFVYHPFLSLRISSLRVACLCKVTGGGGEGAESYKTRHHKTMVLFQHSPFYAEELIPRTVSPLEHKM